MQFSTPGPTSCICAMCRDCRGLPCTSKITMFFGHIIVLHINHPSAQPPLSLQLGPYQLQSCYHILGRMRQMCGKLREVSVLVAECVAPC